MLRLIWLLALAGCFDSDEPNIKLIYPDASVDSVPDACTQEPSHGCCDLMPDTNAVIACTSQEMPSGQCGVAVCFAADCSRIAINFCAP